MRVFLRRLLVGVPLLFSVAVLTFLMIQLMPGSAARVMLQDGATDEAVAGLEQKLGLDDPLPVQLVRWLGNAVQGDLGDSVFSTRPVTEVITERLGATVSIAGAGFLVAVTLGLSIGIFAGSRAGTLSDRAATIGATAGISIPDFWLAALLSIGFSVKLGWFPVIGYSPLGDGLIDWLKSIALPALALGIPSSALIARQMRAALAAEMSSLYVRAGRAVGLSQSEIIRRATRNALIPVVTVIGFQVPVILGGTFVVEQIFGIAGLGDLTVQSIIRRDLPVVQGVVMVIAVFVIIANALVDSSYGLLDPKVRER